MRFYLALGSNLGDRRARLEQGLGGLRRRGLVLDRLSAVYETEPVEAPRGSPPFLNQVASGPLGPGSPSPRALLAHLLEVEREQGRRRGRRNEPRVLDLDLLLYGDLVLREPGLEIPHPRLHRRRFVLEPLRELAPDLVHPVLGETVTELLAAAPTGPSVRPLPSPCGASGPVL